MCSLAVLAVLALGRECLPPWHLHGAATTTASLRRCVLHCYAMGSQYVCVRGVRTCVEGSRWSTAAALGGGAARRRGAARGSLGEGSVVLDSAIAKAPPHLKVDSGFWEIETVDSDYYCCSNPGCIVHY